MPKASKTLLLAALCVLLAPIGFAQGMFDPADDLELSTSRFRSAEVPLSLGAVPPNALQDVYRAIFEVIVATEFPSEAFIDELVLPNLASGAPAPEPRDSSGTCAQDLDGQKFRAAGGSAPFGPVPYEGDGFWPAESVRVVEPPVLDVEADTLVIIDDFDLRVLERELARWDFDMWNSDADTLQPHGHHVLYHSLRILGDVDMHRMWWSAPISLGDDDESALQWARIEIPRNDDASFKIVLVDFSMNVGLVAEAVERIHTLETTWSGSSAAPGTIAVNMSWNLVPCRFLADYTAEERSYDQGEAYRSYHEYLVDVASNAQDQQMLDILREAFDETGFPIEWSDPLFTYLTLLAASQHMASDAMFESGEVQLSEGIEWFSSSGNQGFPFPLPPAVFDGVCAVGATQNLASDDAMARATWSNAASALAPGAWFSFGPSDGEVFEPPYAGTSFAAPFAALAHLAGDMSQTPGLQSCVGDS